MTYDIFIKSAGHSGYCRFYAKYILLDCPLSKEKCLFFGIIDIYRIKSDNY